MVVIGVVIGGTMMPGLCEQVGQKMFVGGKSQKEFEKLTMEKKLAALNNKLDYLIQKSLPMGQYIDDDGVVQSSLRRSGPFSSGSGSGTVRIGN